MRNLLNNYRVCNPKLQDVPTDIPHLVETDEGTVVVNKTTKDTDFVEMSAEEFSLRSLKKAGIDPSSLNIHTTSVNKIGEVSNSLSDLDDIVLNGDLFPDLPTNNDN